jgi:hypothetical protein
MSKPAPPPLVRIINHRTDCLSFGSYRVGEVYAVDAATAAYLATRGFVPADPPAPPPAVTPSLSAPIED